MVNTYAAPALLFAPTPADADKEWVLAFGIIAAVAAALAIPLIIVATICMICGARSFWICYWDVIAWFSWRGC